MAVLCAEGHDVSSVSKTTGSGNSGRYLLTAWRSDSEFNKCIDDDVGNNNGVASGSFT